MSPPSPTNINITSTTTSSTIATATVAATTAMFTPPHPKKAQKSDDSYLPKGDCRYILLHPEHQSQRCACSAFALNQNLPGSMCDCGHQACYHAPDIMEDTSVDRHELEALREKIDKLQDELDWERHSGRIMNRLGQLEEVLEKMKAETESEFKTVYGSISGLWHNVSLFNKRTPYYDDHIEGLVDEQQRIRTRLIEIDDASMRVEDRVEALESSHLMTRPSRFTRRRRKASTPRSPGDADVSDASVNSDETEPVSKMEERISYHLVTIDEPLHIQSFRKRVSSVGSGSQAWTVHVSLLPTSSQPFPFEKDTAAYKRCLSRGLHQMVVIPDSDSNSFKAAINEAFENILRGRPWHPLVAQLCNAKTLRGLPMLRQLDDHLIGSDYNVDFLQRNCTVNDASGKILDLYIAMSEDTISWAQLKDVPPFMPKLEASWTYDPYLDGPGLDPHAPKSTGPDVEMNQPAAGDIVPAWSPSLKRKSSKLSRTSSFGEGEGSRTKLRRPGPSVQCSVELVGRRAETV